MAARAPFRYGRALEIIAGLIALRAARESFVKAGARRAAAKAARAIAAAEGTLARAQERSR